MTTKNLKDALSTLTIEVYESRSKNPKQKWRWRVTAANGRKVANSGEGYARKADAVYMANHVITGHAEFPYPHDAKETA